MSILFNPSNLVKNAFSYAKVFSLKGKWKERKECDLNENENENENDVLDLPSLEVVTFGGSSFECCHVAVFESMWWLSIFILF